MQQQKLGVNPILSFTQNSNILRDIHDLYLCQSWFLFYSRIISYFSSSKLTFPFPSHSTFLLSEFSCVGR